MWLNGDWRGRVTSASCHRYSACGILRICIFVPQPWANSLKADRPMPDYYSFPKHHTRGLICIFRCREGLNVDGTGKGWTPYPGYRDRLWTYSQAGRHRAQGVWQFHMYQAWLSTSVWGMQVRGTWGTPLGQILWKWALTQKGSQKEQARPFHEDPTDSHRGPGMPGRVRCGASVQLIAQCQALCQVYTF